MEECWIIINIKEGYKYKNRIIFEKKLNDKEIEKIKELFKELKENNIEKSNIITGYYKLEHINDDIMSNR